MNAPCPECLRGFTGADTKCGPTPCARCAGTGIIDAEAKPPSAKVICDVCSRNATVVCVCPRCMSEPDAGEKFWACDDHKIDVGQRHRRVRERDVAWLTASSPVVGAQRCAVHYRVSEDAPNLCGSEEDVFTRTPSVATCLACRDAVDDRSATYRAAHAEAVAGFDVPPAETAPYEMVNHPSHYNQIPGIECIDVIEHMPHNIGAAMRYLWRVGLKPGNSSEQELRKSIWYIERQIAFLKKTGGTP